MANKEKWPTWAQNGEKRNPGLRNKKQREAWARNREKHADYRKSHAEELRATWKAWRSTPLAKWKMLALCHSHRARDFGVPGVVSAEDFMAIYEAAKNICQYCGQHYPKRCFDHRIPMSKGGHHVVGNLVFCCRPCNSRKSSLMPHEWDAKMQHLGYPQPLLPPGYWLSDAPAAGGTPLLPGGPAVGALS